MLQMPISSPKARQYGLDRVLRTIGVLWLDGLSAIEEKKRVTNNLLLVTLFVLYIPDNKQAPIKGRCLWCNCPFVRNVYDNANIQKV